MYQCASTVLFASLVLFIQFHERKIVLVYVSEWVLLINCLLAIIGIFISILLMRNKIGMKLFLIFTILLWLVVLSNFFFPRY